MTAAPELEQMFISVDAMGYLRRRKIKRQFEALFGAPETVPGSDVHPALVWLVEQGVKFPSSRDLPARHFELWEQELAAEVATTANILDYAYPFTSVANLKAAGIRGVSRYLASTGSGKIIKKPEYDALLAQDIEVVLNFENTASDYLGGYPKGLENGRIARAMARALGHPDHRKIVFSIDTGPGPATINYATEYIRGCRDGSGTGPQGCYGTRYVLEACRAQGTITGGWQPVGATGWYGNATRDPGADLYQLLSKPYPQWSNSSYDANELRPGVTDYGQQPKPGGTPPLPPTPPPVVASVAVASPFGALL